MGQLEAQGKSRVHSEQQTAEQKTDTFKKTQGGQKQRETDETNDSNSNHSFQKQRISVNNRSVKIGEGLSVALSPDETLLYLSDFANSCVWVLDRHSLAGVRSLRNGVVHCNAPDENEAKASPISEMVGQEHQETKQTDAHSQVVASNSSQSDVHNNEKAQVSEQHLKVVQSKTTKRLLGRFNVPIAIAASADNRYV